MKNIKIIFFGSTSDSCLVLGKLISSPIKDYQLTLAAIVTQPAKPVGRKQILTPTPVALWAKKNKITLLTYPSNPDKPWLYQNEDQVINSLSTFKADLIISACYGQKIPFNLIASAKYGGLNIHPSLLPRFRGADPIPWAIMSGDNQTGVTIVTLSEKFDAGKIIAQKKIFITGKDTSDPLRTHLFAIGAELLNEILSDFISGKVKGALQNISNEPYAKKLTREDGFEPWDNITLSQTDKAMAERIDLKFRALTPWPGLWSKIGINSPKSKEVQTKRIKIIKLHPENNIIVIDNVQLEGKTTVLYSQFQKAYL
jgi:methionyl-tRNA formyltransferase